MCFTAKTDCNRALLDSFRRVFYLEDAALWGAMKLLAGAALVRLRNQQGDGVVIVVVSEHFWRCIALTEVVSGNPQDLMNG